VALPQAFETRGGAVADAVALDRWWNDFHDPQLSELIATAFERSTTARMAYAKIIEARAVRAQTRATTLPSGGISGNAAEQGTKRLWGAGLTQSGYDSYALDFSPSWELDLFGRLAKIRRRADQDAAASTFDFYGTRLALAADVGTSLFQARYLTAQLADAQDGLRIARDLARAGELGEAHGLTATQDVARLEADVASGEAQVAGLSASLRTAKRSLLILVGNPTAPTDTLAISATLDPPPALPALTPGLLLTRRPDVLSAEASLQSAATKVQIDRLALFPKFSIQAGLGLSASGNSPAGLIYAGGTGFWSAAAGVMLPILDRTALMANLRISQAQGQEAVIGYEKAVQTAFGEAENALTNVAANQLRSEQLGRATQQARIAFDAARKGYAAGLTDLTTLLQVERVWLQDRSAFNTSRAALLSDTVTAIRALGGGWNPRSSPSPDQSIPSSPDAP
jgi:NodT family efflux transporter outer membrane factor (OMF) lipoprotein